MERFADFEAFLAIVEKGSQTAAAKHLHRSLQSISRSLASLEDSVGIELVRRNTRQSNPTEAGLAFYRRAKPALAELEAAKREITNERAEPSGLLRVASPVLFASAYVAPAICDFLQRYPQVEIDLTASDRKVDLYDGRFDVAIRVRELPDSELKVRKLGALRVVVFGAPQYFAKHGRPKLPSDLARHQCIVRSSDPDGEKWRFRVRGKRDVVRVGGRFRTDDTAAKYIAVAEGLGIGIGPLWQIRSLLAARRVELVLEEFESPRLPIVAVTPPTKQPSPKAQRFIELLAARMKRERSL